MRNQPRLPIDSAARRVMNLLTNGYTYAMKADIPPEIGGNAIQRLGRVGQDMRVALARLEARVAVEVSFVCRVQSACLALNPDDNDHPMETVRGYK